MESIDEKIRKAAADLACAKYAIALTGAGISTESGIADFRGPKGIWKTDPAAEKKAYQSFDKFISNPKGYWEERLTTSGLLGDLSKYEPNPSHFALAEMEKMGILKWVITQNIDNLHRKAGSGQVLEYHGNAFRLRCLSCNARYEQDDFNLEKMRHEGSLPPRCSKCGRPLKSDVVHFNEPIPADVAGQSLEEARKCDVMLICGTSATVYPFANLPHAARAKNNTVIIEINAEPTPLSREGISDYLIRGRTGEILPRIVRELKKNN